MTELSAERRQTLLDNSAVGIRAVRRKLVDSKNHGMLPRETVDLINQALDEARAVGLHLWELGAADPEKTG